MCRLVGLLGLVFWATAASADVQHNKWCQITTPDFQLVSDLRQEDARSLADRMMRFKLRGASTDAEASAAGSPLEIIAFRRTRDLHRVFATRNIGGLGMFLRERSTLAFVYNDRYPYWARARTAFHEYAHYLQRTDQRLNYPAWYDGRLRGAPVDHVLVKEGGCRSYVPRIVRPSMASARTDACGTSGGTPFTAIESPTKPKAIYAKAWLPVHMLELGHLAGLRRFTCAYRNARDDR